MDSPFEAGRFGSGRAVQRIEDEALLTGMGRYTDDIPAAAEAVMSFLRSPYAHARIESIDVEAARHMPGVIAIYTGAELVAAGVKPIPPIDMFNRPDGSPIATPARRALAHEAVGYVGEAVAAVVAETRDQARDAAEAIAVDYVEMPAVIGVAAAIASGAPTVIEGAADNIACEARHGDVEATTKAFDRAAHVVALDLVNQRVAPSSIEPRSALAEFDDTTRRLTYRLSSQTPTGVMNSLTELIPGFAKGDVRVVVGDVGGGFGMKTGIYPEDIAVAWAARDIGRPVRWQADRSEELVSAVHGRDVVSRAELALDAEGKVLALRVRSYADVGASATSTGVIIQLLIGPWVSTSIYDIGTIDLHFIAVLTNEAPTGAYRGAGRPEAIYLIERLFDAAARELKIDPADLRRRNMIRPEQMPYTNAMAQVYDSGAFERILDQGLELAEWGGFDARRAQSKARGRLRGRGLATFLEWTGGNVFEEKVTVTVSGDGYIEIFSATQAMGQGIATSYAQLAVDIFGVPIEKIRIVQGDTDRGQGFGSAGSRSLFTGGNSVHVAAERTVGHAKGLAAEMLEAAAADIEYRNGRFEVAGTDLGIGLFDVAARQPGAVIRLDSTSSVGGPTWPNACHVCEVEIDPETGHVQVVAYVSVNDIGRVVSPTIARGQVDGGAMQGIGQALFEQVAYDPQSGQLLSGSLMDYALPRAVHAPPFRTEFDTGIPCLTNPLGIKGVGELGTIGATPAAVNAVVDALARAGLGRDAERLQMPLTADRVWRALRGDIDRSPLHGALDPDGPARIA